MSRLLARGMAACYTTLVSLSCGSEPERAEAPAWSWQQLDPRGDTSVVLHRAWAWRELNYDLQTSSVSPDGRYLSYVDWTTGTLTLRDLETGEHQPIIAGTATASIGGCAFSPDGDQIAYSWWSEEHRGYGVRVVDVDGSNPRVLVRESSAHAYISVEDWSAEGHLLLWIRAPEEMVTLVLASVADGSLQVVERLGIVSPQVAVFSPDGRFVAYDHASDPASPDHDIFVTAVSGANRDTLVSDVGDDRLLGWMPDDGGILFYSDRASTPGIWRLPVADGRAAGVPTLMRGDVWNVVPVGFGGERYFFGVNIKPAPQLYVGTIDLDAGRVLTEPSPVGGPAHARTNKGIWSPDGRQLAYIWQGHRDPWWAWRLAVRDLSSGDTRTMRLPFDLDRIWRMEWLPDGRSLAVWGSLDRRLGIYEFNLVSENVAPIRTVDSLQFEEFAHLLFGALALDGSTLYHRRPPGLEGETRWRIVAWDMSSGEEREVTRTLSMPERIAASPDGAMVGFVEADSLERRYRLSVVSASGGGAREVYRSPLFGLQSIVVWWTWDSASLLFAGGTDGNLGQILLRIPVAGGEPQLIRDVPNVLNFRLHPDGRRYLTLDLSNESEIWVVENLVGALEGAR